MPPDKFTVRSELEVIIAPAKPKLKVKSKLGVKKKKRHKLIMAFYFGGADEIRTRDLLRDREAL
jgi:hypothetical protein